MNFANLLTYVTHHSESIIQWLFFSIMGLAALIVGRQIFFKPASDDGASMSAAPLPGEIQDMLTRIIEQTGKLQNVSAEKLADSVPADMLLEFDLLKKDLQTREEEISRLQRSVVAGGETKELTSRVKELEAKLEEYSILEDDIADLSLYKEENVRLKSDLEKMRASGATIAPPEPMAEAPIPVEMAPKVAVEPQPAGSTDDLVAEFAQAVITTAAPSTGAQLNMPKTDDPMADFELTVKAEKQALADEDAPVPNASVPTAAPPTPPAPKREDDSHSGDLFAEFSEEEEDESNLDTDRMMEEMAALISSEAKDSSGSSLEENVDTDKMLEEAKNFTKTS